MKNLKNRITKNVKKKVQLVLFVLTISLFILAASAPNATIGIGR